MGWPSSRPPCWGRSPKAATLGARKEPGSNRSGATRKGARNRSQLRALPRSHAHLPAPQPSGYYALTSTGAVAYTSDDAVTCARRDGSSLVRRFCARTAAAYARSRLTRPARAGLRTARGIFDTRGEGRARVYSPMSLPALGLVVVSGRPSLPAETPRRRPSDLRGGPNADRSDATTGRPARWRGG